MRNGPWILFSALTMLAGTANAHHSIAAVYDSSRQLTLEGVVARFDFIHPHPFITLTVTGDQAGEWRLEMDNRFELAAAGMDAQTLKPGDRLIVSGSRARDETRGIYIRRLERPADGFQYEQVGSSPRVRPANR